VKLHDSFGFDPLRPRDLVKQGDDEAAVAYINQFVDAGSVRAMIAMADYFFDKGDKEASLSWMDRVERSIADDDFVSPIFLASAYTRGLGRGEAYERHQKAFALRERVAESGNVSVIHEMMSNYLFGLNGAPKDHERFIYWAKKAAALGSEAAIQVLRDEGLPVPDGKASPS
jgi:TPR repeat protein